MVFVRVKKIKEKEYAYLVENRWTSNGSRQKVGAYLGAVKKLQKINNKSTEVTGEFKTSINLLIKNELENHGFILENNTYKKENVKIDLEKLEFIEKKIVLSLNEGFLCNHTIKQLLEFKPSENITKTGKKLANAILEAGLKIDQESFVKLVESIHPKEANNIEEETFNPEEFYY